MEKRYQVFVSSTYADLKEERGKVIQTLMEMDCIPAGMELFPALDEEQFAFIRKVIDDCDYYIIIIGGRYGSLTPEGISYTEKEYDYAVSLGLKVLAFVHESPDDIPFGKSEKDPSLRQKLEDFRTKVTENRLVKFWKNAKDLPGLVALSLTKTIKTYPAIGWIRASKASSDEILYDINSLRKENNVLKDAIKELETKVSKEDIQNIASLDEMFEVSILYTVRSQYNSHQEKQNINISWGELFSRFAPDILAHPNDSSANYRLGSALYRKLNPSSKKTVKVQHDDFQTIKTQLMSLGLVNITYSPTTKGQMALFWNLTAQGITLMKKLRSVKSNPEIQQ